MTKTNMEHCRQGVTPGWLACLVTHRPVRV